MTIIEQSGSVVVDVRDATKTLCVYEHYIGGGDTEQIIFVNVCSLVDVHKLTDARINTEWARIFTGGGSVGVRVLATGMDRRALLHWARQYMDRIGTPRCNEMGYNRFNQLQQIRCVNNGKVYNSQNEAAEDLGLSQGAISRHLRGQLSRVKGHIFEMVAT